MFQSLEHLIEEAWFRYSADKSSTAKGLTRPDLQACVNAACERLAVKVANQPNYNLLLRRVVTFIEKQNRPLTFPAVYHPTLGWGTGLSVLEGDHQAAVANVRAEAAETLSKNYAADGATCIRDAVIEWNIKALAGHVVALRHPFTQKLNISTTASENELAVEILNSGQVNLYRAGAAIGTNVATALAGQRVRIAFDDDGNVKLQTISAAGVVVADVTVNSPAIEVDCSVAFLFTSANTILTNPSIAQKRDRMATLMPEHRLLKETVQTLGTVAFLPPWNVDADPYVAPLTFSRADSYRAYPRLGTIWYWAWGSEQVDGAVGSSIQTFPGNGDESATLPSNRLEVTGIAIPTWADIPAQLHEALVLELIGVAQERNAGGGTARGGRKESRRGADAATSDL